MESIRHSLVPTFEIKCVKYYENKGVNVSCGDSMEDNKGYL